MTRLAASLGGCEDHSQPLPGTTLDVGVHEITLTATDSDGQTGMASALLLVHGDDME